ncbi:MAG TPA: oxaloacetate-decarboxylating malate dehydrogenase, partial [Opitutus sp.]|nr:oxaloacetate-decarboxylating malate dehydrogenase [Opitutus sp.]
IDEFVTAVSKAWPRALLQWEDFGNTNAFRLLHRYRDRICSFNDDIQGTAAVALAGLIASLRLTGSSLKEQRLLFLGAGEAGTGIADLFVAAARAEGLSEKEARERCWFVDSQGLVVQSRLPKLAEHKVAYAHAYAPLAHLADAIDALRPTALIGVSGQRGAFTPEIIQAMSRLNARPVIFALSNPTAMAECTAEDAYRHSAGRAIFASGSPFPPVTFEGKTFVPGQGNNVYIFPGVGFGALVSQSRLVSDGMFLTAARTLAALVTDEDLAMGRVYPSLTQIRSVSVAIATAVADEAFRSGTARAPRPHDLTADVQARMFQPDYRPLVPNADA